ncbi:hypothetical protein PtB15_1B668 [Puccinia triticina]|nr:hypothetical protein PtB15_1B668 [Puccinia triticina]
MQAEGLGTFSAGIMHPDNSDAVQTEEKIWDLTMRVNCKGVWWGCKYGIQAMLANPVDESKGLKPGGSIMVPDTASKGAKREHRVVHLPMGRFGKAVEQARVALFLACKDSSYVTGTDFMVDGGAHACYVTPTDSRLISPPPFLPPSNGECALKLQPQLAKPTKQARGVGVGRIIHLNSKRLNGNLLPYPIRLESTNQELAAILKNQVIRIKNVLSSLQLRTLGRICEVLLALGNAIKIQPNVLLHELKFFGLATNTAGLF